MNIHIASLSPMDGFDDVVAVLGARLKDIDLAYDGRRRLLTTSMRFKERPCFSVQHLADYRTLYDGLKDAMGHLPFESRPVRFLLHTSAEPGVWCMGGDLDLFGKCIREGDAETLRSYGYECLHSGYLSYMGLGLSVVTMCLVQGRALGGGFESARSCNILFAEEHSAFGLPELNFNMFPGMGAYSYIAERIGMHRVEAMILGTEIHSARSMHEMGAVDFVVPTGKGLEAVHAFVDRNGRRFSALASMMEARRLSSPIDIDVKRRVVDAWVECALRVGEGDLKTMDRLVRAQMRFRRPAPALEVA